MTAILWSPRTELSLRKQIFYMYYYIYKMRQDCVQDFSSSTPEYWNTLESLGGIIKPADFISNKKLDPNSPEWF